MGKWLFIEILKRIGLLAPGEDGQWNRPFARLNPAWTFLVANDRRG